MEGTWSATLEWLVGRLAPRFPALAFAEVRYRIKSWKRLELCEEDVRAAVAEVGAPRTLLVGFSMGGAVASLAADAPGVEGVLGLAPWLPDRLDLGPPRRPPPRRAARHARPLAAGSPRRQPGSLAPRLRPCSRTRRAGHLRADPRRRARRRAPLAVGCARAAPSRRRLGEPGGGVVERLRRSGLASTPRQLRFVRHPDSPHQPEPLEPADHEPRQVPLLRLQPVPRRGRERVMVVVPALAEHEHRDQPVVPRLVP